MQLIRIFLVGMLMLTFSSAQAVRNHSYRDFWNPTYLGQRLNYCSFDGKACGKEVADKFCELLGYDSSSQNIIAHNIGLTNYLLTRMRCVGWTCDGFKKITCTTNMAHIPPKPYHYREQRFEHPRFENYRISWCYVRSHGCGKRAADSFCSHMGFLKAHKFVKQDAVGATKTIGSQELCFGPKCNGFAHIICRR